MTFAARLTLPRDPRKLELALEGRIAESRLELQRGEAGELYRSGVRYRREQPGHEDWQTASETLALGHGDCEDLVIWRVAELREQGIDARARVETPRRNLWHVVVEYPDGWVEDPSAVLGMLTPSLRRRHPLMHDPAALARTPEVVAERAEIGALEAAVPQLGAAADEDIAALIDADVAAYAVEESPVAVTPSVRWAATPRRDGTYDATISVRLTDGSEVRPTVRARSRRTALARAAQLARAALARPEVRGLVPAQAAAAVAAAHALGNLARKGKLAEAGRKLASRALGRLARALA